MKNSSTPQPAVVPRKSKGRKARAAKLAGTIAAIDQVTPKAASSERLVRLLQSWLSDESGYDEVAWPQLKKALDQERNRRGARRLFDA